MAISEPLTIADKASKTMVMIAATVTPQVNGCSWIVASRERAVSSAGIESERRRRRKRGRMGGREKRRRNGMGVFA